MNSWSIDWMLNPTNLQNLADCNYDDRRDARGKSEGFTWLDPPHFLPAGASAGFISAIIAKANTG